MPINEYKEYLEAHEDLEGILSTHRWLAIRYSAYFPYRSGEREWYFLFLMGEKCPKNHALDLIECMHKYPKIIFGSIENKIYK